MIVINNNYFETLMKNRPHVVLLGAGASVAAIPNGDKNGNKISVMNGFIDKLGMRDIINSVSLNTESENLEDIYSELHDRPECKSIVETLEGRIHEYFCSFEVPNEPIVYDFLILSLTKKDLIATFNWDPLLLQSYSRVRSITDNLPQLAFLHGNVAVGICEEHDRAGNIDNNCPICNNHYTEVPLLYPVKEKDYHSNTYIRSAWKLLKSYLEKAYMLTIFGYSAPKSDESAIDMLKYAWGSVENRSLEEVEIIDIREEDEIIKSWEEFIHTHHYSVHSSYFDSSLGKFPRRTCEALFDRTMECKWLDPNKGFKVGMNQEEIKIFLKDLIKDEKSNTRILKNPYIYK